jgi:hypothetical protein
VQPNPGDDVPPTFCDRCSAELVPGSGDFYQIRIEAVADPTPPQLPDEKDPRRLRTEIEQTLARMQDLSPQEALDQVCRRLTLYLCVPCYRRWIENPTG